MASFLGSRGRTTPVYSNVYCLLPGEKNFISSLMAGMQKVGIGIYHSSIVVHNREFHFGGHEFASSGIFCTHIREIECPQIQFKEQLMLGETTLSNREIDKLIRTLDTEWTGVSYNIMSRNCNHFTSSFAQALGASPLPSWVNRLASVGDKFVGVCLYPVSFVQKCRNGEFSSNKSSPAPPPPVEMTNSERGPPATDSRNFYIPLSGAYSQPPVDPYASTPTSPRGPPQLDPFSTPPSATVEPQRSTLPSKTESLDEKVARLKAENSRREQLRKQRLAAKEH
eukprot:GCRY01002757.1.p1 GENE.GCRY01002757.1~~GCRY01002757.1.p1  ORF type:complete len:282 (+),score=23.18 GCRY01002757.1:249-1094(+)